MFVSILIGAVVFYLFVLLFWKASLYRFRFPRSDEPPFLSGWIPYFGMAFRYGKNPFTFMKSLCEKYRSIVSVYIAGRKMTFIYHPLNYPPYFRTPNVTFQNMALKISESAFFHSAVPAGLPEDIHRLYHPTLGRDQPLGEMSMKLAEKLNDYLREQFLPSLRSSPSYERSLDLYAFIQESMFMSSIPALYGDCFSSYAEAKQCFDDFILHDNAFYFLVGGIPRQFLKGVEKSLDRNAEKFWKQYSSASTAVSERYKVFDKYRDQLTDYDRQHVSITLFWASQANTIPACFWVIYHLIRNPVAVTEIFNEYAAVVNKYNQENPDKPIPLVIKDGTEKEAELGPLNIRMDLLKQLPLLDSAVYEALRMTAAPSPIREALEDMHVKVAQIDDQNNNHNKNYTIDNPAPIVYKEYFVPKGSYICLFPQLTHCDPTVFPDPDKFIYNRFVNTSVLSGPKRFYKDGHPLIQPLIPFGGGVSLCPGRLFAINEMKVSLLNLLWKLEFSLENESIADPPLDRTRTGFGTLPPIGDVKVNVRIRKTPPIPVNV